jgi:hypothetical protein
VKSSPLHPEYLDVKCWFSQFKQQPANFDALINDTLKEFEAKQ